MILQNSSTIQGQKALFSKFEEFSRTKVKIFQVCAISVRARLILYAILTPKFTLWIYVVVMECRSLFSSTSCDLDLRSQFSKKCTHSRSPTLFMVAFHICYVDTSWTLASHQMFPGHCDLDSGFSSSKVELRAYLYII